MGKENKARSIDVFCRDNHLLFERYRKVGGGRLQKVYRDEIGRDHTASENLPNEVVIFCNQCEPPRPIAQVGNVHGRTAYIVFQTGIRKTVT